MILRPLFPLALTLAALPVRASVETERVYLSGRGCSDACPWEFTVDAGRRAGERTTIPVPSCWEMQGFGTLQYGCYLEGVPGDRCATNAPCQATGVYRRRFAAPEGFEDKAVKLVFEAVFTDCEVVLNGHWLGTHQGGFCPFAFDVTGVLQLTNELAVTVRSESANASVNLAERRGDFWVFGGIWRPVYLEVMPRLHIERVAVDARADGTLDAELFVSDGTRRRVHEVWDRPRLWTAETPNLYDKAFELTDASGKTVHRVVKRIGFRTVEARRGDCLRVNGRRVTVKGINRHSFNPDTGRTLSAALNRADVRLIKSLNMNAVRSSHYPPDPEFLEACDELGLYVIDELCGWQHAVDTAVGTSLVQAFVRRDQFHPSVLWWANGNEGGFNLDLDDVFRTEDLQRRPVLHPWAEYGAFHTKHYRDYGQTGEFLAGDWLYMPTEFQHGLYDGGHAAGLGELWQLMMSSPRTIGGFLWDLRDQGVRRYDGSLDCHGDDGADGLVGPCGEESASCDAVREIWSPVATDVSFADGRLKLNNRFDFTDLSRCRFEWEALSFADDAERVLAGGSLKGVAASPHQDVSVTLPAVALGGSALRLRCFGPDGLPVLTSVFSDERAFELTPTPASGLTELPTPRLVALKLCRRDNRQVFDPVSADFSWRAVTNAEGSVNFSWSIATTNEVDVLGVSFDVDERTVESKRWLGKGPHPVWRNRPEGPRLGIWENAYGDGYEGRDWKYPRFKGFFPETRWMAFSLKDGACLRFELPERPACIGVFFPKDGVDEQLYAPPDLGVSVLAVWPAIGNKFSQAKDTGPLGQSVRLERPVEGRVRVLRQKEKSR